MVPVAMWGLTMSAGRSRTSPLICTTYSLRQACAVSQAACESRGSNTHWVTP